MWFQRIHPTYSTCSRFLVDFCPELIMVQDRKGAPVKPWILFGAYHICPHTHIWHTHMVHAKSHHTYIYTYIYITFMSMYAYYIYILHTYIYIVWIYIYSCVCGVYIHILPNTPIHMLLCMHRELCFSSSCFCCTWWCPCLDGLNICWWYENVPKSKLK